MPKGDTMQRCFETLKAFNEGPVTVGYLSKRLNMSRMVAKRWIDQASRYYPIIENGKKYGGVGRPATVYELLREGKPK